MKYCKFENALIQAISPLTLEQEGEIALDIAQTLKEHNLMKFYSSTDVQKAVEIVNQILERAGHNISASELHTAMLQLLVDTKMEEEFPWEHIGEVSYANPSPE